MWEKILDVFFPDRCVGCGRSGTMLCAFCERHIVRRPRALSPWSAALFEYRNTIVKKAIHALKYSGKKRIATYFGNALYREFLQPTLRNGRVRDDMILLVPIPASRHAERLRGYNHAAAIAHAISAAAAADGFAIALDKRLLMKIRENDQQVTMRGKTARATNVANAFVVSTSFPHTEKTLILIDDVITTGATVGEARRALKVVGAKRVLALAVAH